MLAVQSDVIPVYTPERQETERAIHTDTSLYLLGSVSDPEDSARLVAEMQPDILIVDLRLCGVAGLAVLKHLKAKIVEIPTIVMNDKADRALRDQSIRLGARFFFDEGQSFEQIRSSVAVLLKQRSSQADRLV